MVRNILNGITHSLRIDTPEYGQTMEQWQALEDQIFEDAAADSALVAPPAS